MGKSVYSIVLDDAVVEAVDLFAGGCGLSRSAAINRILAQYVQISTKEQHIQQVFEALEQLASGTALQRLSFSDAQMQMRSPLRYKYNPTVRYQIELYHQNASQLGTFRVGMRTQNQTLLQYLEQFYRLWVMLEQHYLLKGKEIGFEIDNGKFIRALRAVPTSISPEQLGELLLEYTNLFDQCLKTFFENPSQQGAANTEHVYQNGLNPPLMTL